MTRYSIFIVAIICSKGEASKLFHITSVYEKIGPKTRRSFAEALDIVHSMSAEDWENTVDWTKQNSKTLLYAYNH